MAGTLQFIAVQVGAQGGAPSAAERRLIRSHVMKGKNAGRPRRSSKKPKTSVPVKRVLYTCTPSTTRQPLWHDLCLTSFPQELDPESTKIMHRWFFDISDELFPPRFCSKFDILKSIWVNCILADEAYFHSTLAISSSYINFYQRKPSITTKTLHHIVKAYKLVNIKLSSPESVSDSALAAVVALVMYQQIHREYSVALIHLNGLHQMVKLRGGIAKVMKGSRVLALKILRVDVELALQNGTQPLFDNKGAVPSAVVAGSPKVTHLTEAFPRGITTATELSNILIDLLGFASLLNSKESDLQSKLDPLTFMEILLSLLYRLVWMAPFGHPIADHMWCTGSSTSHAGVDDDELALLGMLAFMRTFLPDYGRADDESSYPLLCKHLERAIGNFRFRSAAPENNEAALPFLLWALFIGGMTVWKDSQRVGLLPLILDTSNRLGLCDWAAVRQQLCRLPWIHSAHDAAGYKLWQDAQLVR